MKRIEVELLSEAANNAVLRLPGRAYPGIVVQGDSLKILCGLAEELHALAQDNQCEAIADLAHEIKELLTGRLAHYEAALDAHHVTLPYAQ